MGGLTGFRGSKLSPGVGLPFYALEALEPRLLLAAAPPAVTPTGSPLAYQQVGAAKAVDPGLSVSDPDSPALAGATVQITANYALGHDVLSFTNRGSIKGTFSAATGTLTLTGPASPGQYQSALRSVTYRFSGSVSTWLDRTVTFTVSDGGLEGSAERAVVMTVVSVTAPQPGAAEEGPTAGTLRITRNTIAATPLKVNYAVRGTASRGADYTAIGTSAIIPAGQAWVDIAVMPVDDARAEPAETVILTPSAGAAYNVDPAAKTATVTIADNEPVVGVAAVQPIADEEGPTAGTLRITRNNIAATPLKVNYVVRGTAARGPDYIAIGTSATIPAGQAWVDIAVMPVDDALAEFPETVILGLLATTAYNVDPAAKIATATIADNEPVISVTAPGPDANEEGPTAGTLRITRSNIAATPLKVNYVVRGTASRGADYSAIGTSAIIPAGQASVDIAVMPVDDARMEPPETVILTLSSSKTYNVNPAAASATVTIGDNDLGPDAFEVDDTAAGARTLVPGAAPQQHSLHAPTDDDWLKFTVPKDGRDITLAVNTLPDAKISVELLGPNSSTNLFDSGDYVGSFFLMESLSAGTYYVHFNEYGRDATLLWYQVLLQFA
jgi:hypothetical protein